MPPVSGLSSIALVVGTFVAFAGLEVNAVHIAHLKGPPKNYLKAVMLAAVTVFTMYLLGSLAISVAVPDASLELTSGASQAFTVYADGFGVPGLSNVLSGLLVLGALAASIAWIAGPSRSMWLVGKAGYLPRGLQKTNKNDVQMPLLLLQGAVVTVLSFVFVVAPNTSAAFAMLQDVSISLYMLMYVCMFAAAIKLRRSQPDRERPIKIRFLPVIAGVGILSAISAIILGLTPPAGYSSMSAGTYAAIIATGVIVLAIPPQFIHRFRKPSWSTESEPAADRRTRRRRLTAQSPTQPALDLRQSQRLRDRQSVCHKLGARFAADARSRDGRSVCHKPRRRGRRSEDLADVADVRLGLLPDLGDVAAEHQLARGEGEALDLFEGGLRWHGQGARIGDEVDQRRAVVFEGPLDRGADVVRMHDAFAVQTGGGGDAPRSRGS